MEDNFNNIELQGNQMPMNNNYNEPPKNNSGIKVLLIILIILVLCLIGLTCYKMFIYDKKDNNKSNPPVEEKKDKEEETQKAEETDKEVEKESAYAKYLNKLSSEISSKYKDGDTIGPSSTYQHTNSTRVGGYDTEYYVVITKDKTLKVNDKKIADNVLAFFIADKGQGGAKALYYIDVKGDLYSVDHEVALVDNTEMVPRKLSYKNIVAVWEGVTGPTRNPIFVDIEGNMYVGER